MISGLTTQEMLLIQAECMARLGQWQNALSVLTPLREVRYRTGTATALAAATQAEAIREVLAERVVNFRLLFVWGTSSVSVLTKRRMTM